MSDPLIGTVVDNRYVLRHMIARGSMGRVYEAEQRPLGRTVAIKILDIKEEQVEGEGFTERFLREASTLARLSDPHTVRIFDFGFWEGRSCLVMEFIDGQPLSHVVKRTPLPPLEAISVAMQICSSLSEAHKLGVVHRDLKLSNILVSRRGDGRLLAKVIDFGLVKDVAEEQSELTAVGQLLGSPMYMAPEQIRADSIDQRADIYALGVVLYRMLMGARPFRQRGTPELLFAHLSQPPLTFAQANPDVSVPPCLEWTVMRCMEKTSSDRFASAGELRRALKACRIAIEEPSLAGLTLGLRHGTTVLPPELSDISSFGSLVRQGATSSSMSVLRAPPPESPKGNRGLVVAAVVVLLLLVGGAAVAAGVLLFRSEPEPAFVPIESPTIQAAEPVEVEPEEPEAPAVAEEPAAPPVVEEPEAPAAPVRRTSRRPPPSSVQDEVPEAPPPAPPPVEPSPAPEPSDAWEQGSASDLVDPWSDE